MRQVISISIFLLLTVTAFCQLMPVDSGAIKSVTNKNDSIPDQIIDGDSLVLNLSDYFNRETGEAIVYTVTAKSEPFAISTRIQDSLLIMKCISSYLSSRITVTATSGSFQVSESFTASGSRNEELIQGFVKVNDTDIYYEVVGSGIPIVFIHVFPVDCRSWNYQLDELAKHFKIIRYDMVGYGKSDVPSAGMKYRENLKVLLDSLEVASAHFCGACIGSGVAIDFFLGYPEYCKSIISAGPWAFGHYSKATQKANDVMDTTYSKFIHEGSAAALEYLIKGNSIFQDAIPDPETQSILMEIGAYHSWWYATNNSFNGFVDQSAIEHLELITVPTLVITADHDIIPSREVAFIMEREIPNSNVITLSDAGHIMWLDKPSEFNQTMLDFLKTVSVEEIESENLNQVRIYPNPTRSFINIISGQSLHQSIEITSRNGQLIFSKEMEGTTHQIDLSSFQRGVYCITIRSEDFVTTRKIIKL